MKDPAEEGRRLAELRMLAARPRPMRQTARVQAALCNIARATGTRCSCCAAPLPGAVIVGPWRRPSRWRRLARWLRWRFTGRWTR